MQKEIVLSPINYWGSKEDLINFIIPYFPKDVNTFYDLFGGTAIISANAPYNKIVYNDYNKYLSGLIDFLIHCSINNLQTLLNKYVLKTKDQYIWLCKNYIDNPSYDKLYLLILYSELDNYFFIKKYIPLIKPSNFDINTILNFKNAFEKKNIKCESKNYYNFLNIITKEDFVYLDPPYFITTNANTRMWKGQDEIKLYTFLDELNKRNIRFLMSNMITYDNKNNKILKAWCHDNHIDLITSWNNPEEVIIKNY